MTSLSEINLFWIWNCKCLRGDFERSSTWLYAPFRPQSMQGQHFQKATSALHYGFSGIFPPELEFVKLMWHCQVDFHLAPSLVSSLVISQVASFTFMMFTSGSLLNVMYCDINKAYCIWKCFIGPRLWGWAIHKMCTLRAAHSTRAVNKRLIVYPRIK